MLKTGIIDESFKYYNGVFFDSSKPQIKRFPKELWDKYPDLFKVPGGCDLFSKQSIKLSAFKNSFVAFQVAVSCENDFRLTVGSGAQFPMRQHNRLIRLVPECSGGFTAQLNIEQRVIDDNRSLKCDVLSRDECEDYRADDVAMVWCEIPVPRDAEAGVYNGKIKLYESDFFGDEKQAGVLNFSFTIGDVVILDVKDSGFYLNLWQHNSNIARHYEVERFSDEHFAIMAHYIKSLAALGQRSVCIVASDAPWAGQFSHLCPQDAADMYEYNMISIIKEPDGRFVYDFTAMQRYIDLCFSYGIDTHIELFGLAAIWQDYEFGFGRRLEGHPDTLRLSYLDRVDGCMKWIQTGAEADLYIKAIHDYFIANGLMDKVLISADEPLDSEGYREIVDRIKKIAPQFRFSAAINTTAHIRDFHDNTDVFSIILPSVGAEWEKLNEYRTMYNKTVTWYVCCGPGYPNMFISSHLLETRVLGLLTGYLKLDGFLRWDYTVWNNDPRGKLSWQTFHAGDANFVYPGNDGKPLLSLRYKQILRGVEDYMLYEQLRAHSPERAEQVMGKIAGLIFKTDGLKQLLSYQCQQADEVYRLEYDLFEQARALLAEELK